ncbi:hypothetical protein ACOSQ3_022711 [Xanthoceras sorbifolium]
MPLFYWWEAFQTAVHLINLLPTPTLSDSSPFECLFQKSLDYLLLKPFGCACVYMDQPAGFEDTSKPGFVCKLVKSLYGLKQVPRAWFEKLKFSLLKWGFVNSRADSSLFIFKAPNVILILLVYVDDILVTGNNELLVQKLVADLHATFALKDLGDLNFFLGFEACRSAAGLLLTHSKYAHDLLKKTNMLDAHACPTPMSVGTKLHKSDGDTYANPTLYRSTVGALQYLTLTRPDLSFAVNKLSQYLASPTAAHWTTCKRVLRYIKGTIDHGLFFAASSHSAQLVLEGFSDADWASNIDDRKSTSGWCIFLSGSLISWSSRKQKVVARSSCEAEYRSLAQATAEVVWVEALLTEMGIKLHQSAVLWCDNTGAGALAHNPVFHSRTKHIELDLHFVRDKIEAKELDVRYIPTEHQPADILTKPITIARFNLLKGKLILDKSQIRLRGDDKP